jgi:hypothetical protein
MNDPIFSAAMANVETCLRAARSAAETGDAGAVSSELVRAALTLGAQMGSLQTRFAASYNSTPQAKIIIRALRGLEVTGVQAFARVEELRDQTSSLPDVGSFTSSEYETPYSSSEQNDYVP